MTDPERERLIEQIAGAWRPTKADGGVASLPQWHDASPEDRREAFDVARTLRVMEAALAPDGVSSTGREVLARIRKAQRG